MSESKDYPRTVEGAVQAVLSIMPAKLKADLREIEEELDAACRLNDLGRGMQIRALLGLWGKNPELMAGVPRHYRHPDNATLFIELECWRALRQSGSP